MDMQTFIIENEPFVRAGFFVSILVIMALWEIFAPRRQLTVSKLLRWTNNIGLVVLNTLLLRLLFPAAAVGVAVYADSHDWGLLHVWLVPMWVAIPLSIIAMDFVVYLQHVLVHAVPMLWRLHRVHHADLDYDLTTGARFHPIEIILSMLIKFATIVVLGPPVIAVIAFEIILNGMAMFNHGNVRLPLVLDKVIRRIFVTPDMHRVHHSTEDDEANSNFGFNLSIWDRIFGTYAEQPRKGHEGMTIGIRQFRDVKNCSWLTGLLMMPFKGKMSGYVINRRQWSDDKDE